MTSTTAWQWGRRCLRHTDVAQDTLGAVRWPPQRPGPGPPSSRAARLLHVAGWGQWAAWPLAACPAVRGDGAPAGRRT